MRQEVEWFANEMEYKLQQNDHKNGWSDLNTNWLYRKLLEEVKELSDQIYEGDERSSIVAKSADVANIVMMIANNNSKGDME